MRAAIGLFVSAVVCIAIAWWVAALPGSVTMVIAGTTLETSTPFALLLLAILFVVLYALFRLLAFLVSIPARWRRRGSARARTKGDLALNRALIAMAADDAGGARREADRGRRLLGDTPLTLLIAAQAGRQAGREDEAAALFEQLAERPDARLLGLRGLMRMAVEKEEWDRAATLAGEAEKVHPGAAWLRDERRFMAQATGDWKEALRLSTPATKAALAVTAARHETDAKAALALARQAFEAEPGLAPAAVTYAEALRGAGKARQAQDVLRQAWSAAPHPDLARAFAAEAGDKVAAAREVAVLVRAAPDNAEAFLAVGRAALEAGLFAEARRQIEQAKAAGHNQRRLWSLAADVAMADGRPEEAAEALHHVADADSDPAWQCTNCGTVSDGWQPMCETCRSTGTIRWQQPREPVPASRRVPTLALGADGLTA